MGTSADWDRRYSGPGLQWGSGPNARFAAEVEGLPPGRALDLGAGEGRNAIHLAALGWDATAVDFSASGLARAHRLAADRGVSITTEVADLATYAPPERAFDLVAVIYLQVPDPPFGDIVRRAADAVAPGGTFLLINHDLSNLEGGHGGPQDPAMLTRVDAVTANLGQLVVDTAQVVERHVTTDDGNHTALDTFVRAHRTD